MWRAVHVYYCILCVCVMYVWYIEVIIVLHRSVDCCLFGTHSVSCVTRSGMFFFFLHTTTTQHQPQQQHTIPVDMEVIFFWLAFLYFSSPVHSLWVTLLLSTLTYCRYICVAAVTCVCVCGGQACDVCWTSLSLLWRVWHASVSNISLLL